MKLTGKLMDKVALITGGTSGIGYESARLFRDEGAAVIVTGTDAAKVTRVAKELGIDSRCSDVTNMEDIDLLMEYLRRRYGRLDILFANAGSPGAPRPIQEVDESMFDRIVSLNFRGHFFTVQKALPLMCDGGSVILTSSVGAHSGLPLSLVYAASKAAVRSLSRGLAAELMPRCIRVNTLTPGLFNTPIFEKLGAPAGAILKMLTEQVPMGRAGTPIEAATAALFLAGPDSSFMTGTELRVTGGQSDI